MLVQTELHLDLQNNTPYAIRATYEETFYNGRRQVLILLEPDPTPSQSVYLHPRGAI